MTEQTPWALVVDDTEASRYATARLLRSAGYATREASTGREALQMALERPDVIVLDVNLPDLNGFEVVRALRADPRTALLPVLHLSASYLSHDHQVQGLDNGADAYLTHPVEPSVFFATLRALVRTRRLEEQLQQSVSDWHATFDAIGDGVIVVRQDGTVIRANASARRFLGTEAVQGGDWLELMTGCFSTLDRDPLVAALADGRAAVREVTAGDRWLRVAMDPMPARSGEAAGMVVVLTDISDRRAAEAERQRLLEDAQAARGEAEAANRIKGEFLAMMSHEIRTPINAMLGYAQLLDMGITGRVSREQRQHLDRLRRSGSHLLSLVNELLDLARVDSGELRLEREVASLDGAVDDALAVARPMAADRGITVQTDGGRAGVMFVGDSGRVRQILINLLSNAIKFSHAGGTVSVLPAYEAPPPDSVLPAGVPCAALSVIDDGIGVEPDKLVEIFEPFVQGDQAMTRLHGGSGLGLAISRRLARLMHGDITVRTAPGAGARFTLWLPAASAPARPETVEMAVAARQASGQNPMFEPMGRELSRVAADVTQGLVTRLRGEPGLPPAGALSDAQLRDHLPALLIELSQALVIVGEEGADVSGLLSDGHHIRSEIASRHGTQRQRLGWSEQHLGREFDLLEEEVTRAIRSCALDDNHAEAARELMSRLLEQARAAMVRGYRQAAGTAG
jgi:PAS domain S-box-containing protein